VVDHQNAIRALGCLNHLSRLGRIISERLLYKHMLASLERCESQLCMSARWGCYRHGVDVGAAQEPSDRGLNLDGGPISDNLPGTRLIEITYSG
jgi:hypothetical protein